MISSRRNSLPVPLLNLGARGLGLIGRFGLAIFMAKYLGLSDIGQFGLIAGMAGLMPAASGLGLNFYLNRTLVGTALTQATVLIRDRLVITMIVTVAILLMVALPSRQYLKLSRDDMILAMAIIFIETIGFDLHMSLISLGKPLIANLLLFVRSSAWAFPAIAIGLFHAATRSAHFLLLSWLTSLVVYLGCLALVARHWPIRQLAHTKIDWAQIRSTIRNGWLIYLNDLGIAGMLYIDRYIVAQVLGLSLAGAFTLYWTLTNGIHILVTAAVIQVSLPSLVLSLKAEDGSWLDQMERQLRRVLLTGLSIGAAIYFVAQFLLPAVGVGRLGEHPIMLALMVVGTLLRLYADQINFGLYSRGLDRPFALINIFGLLLNIGLDFALGWAFGLNGIGLAMVVSPAVLLVIRLAALKAAGAPLPRVWRT